MNDDGYPETNDDNDAYQEDCNEDVALDANEDFDPPEDPVDITIDRDAAREYWRDVRIAHGW